MNNEIKEILDKLKKKEEIYLFQIKNETSFNSDEYEAHLLLEYITKLQEENKELKEDKSKMFETAVKNNNKLMDRIYNAIEYVKSNEFIGKIRLSSENKQSINKLLEILQGSDKE